MCVALFVCRREGGEGRGVEGKEKEDMGVEGDERGVEGCVEGKETLHGHEERQQDVKKWGPTRTPQQSACKLVSTSASSLMLDNIKLTSPPEDFLAAPQPVDVA